MVDLKQVLNITVLLHYIFDHPEEKRDPLVEMTLGHGSAE